MQEKGSAWTDLQFMETEHFQCKRDFGLESSKRFLTAAKSQLGTETGLIGCRSQCRQILAGTKELLSFLWADWIESLFGMAD